MATRVVFSAHVHCNACAACVCLRACVFVYVRLCRNKRNNDDVGHHHDGGRGGGGGGGGGNHGGGGGGGGSGGIGFNNFNDRDDQQNGDFNNEPASFNTYGLSASFLDSLGIQGPLHTKVFVANVSIYCTSDKHPNKPTTVQTTDDPHNPEQTSRVILLCVSVCVFG